jgi:hypothetical protein
MKRLVPVVVLALAATVSVFAQAPKGWMVRADRSASASDPDGAGSIKFMLMGSTYHAITPQAAVFWTPSDTAKGNYTVKGTFTLMKPSGHTNYYGIVFGGHDLENGKQGYLYFLVAQDGTWLIKQRSGDAATSDVKPKTPSDAVKKPDASGKSVNVLEVRVMADKIDYVVNGTVVTSTPKSGATANTDGIYGMRMNHLLEVQVDGFGLSK